MFGVLKSEFTKILTLRSTYIVVGVMIVLAILAGIVAAAIAAPNVTARIPISSLVFQNAIYGVLSLTTGIFAIVASLIILNEYRHNTIAYTFTASRSRYTVFAAKVIAALGYALAVTLVLALFAVLAATITLAASGVAVTTQKLEIGALILHLGLYVSFYTLVGLFLGFILRNIIIVIVIVFALPIVENLAGILLKDGAQYLPFRTFGALANTGEAAASASVAAVAFVYLLGLAALAVVLFKKRDA